MILKKILINKLMSNNILPNLVLCQICKKQMKLDKDASWMDYICFILKRYRKKKIK